MGTLYRLWRRSGLLRGESLGQGSERPRLCAQINAWSADKTQLSFLCSCWSPAGVKEEAWVCHFTPEEGAGKYLVKGGHSGGVTLVQQKASLLCPDLHCPFLCRFDVQLHSREPFASSLGNRPFLRLRVKHKIGDTLFVLSWGIQLLQKLSLRTLLWLELGSLQLYLQKD